MPRFNAIASVLVAAPKFSANCGRREAMAA